MTNTSFKHSTSGSSHWKRLELAIAQMHQNFQKKNSKRSLEKLATDGKSDACVGTAASAAALAAARGLL
eukprot:m.45114 g.45114  ORF g.45114 m.45114 type:complete len:69 (-) comp14632_c0_seq2:242-448(-)